MASRCCLDARERFERFRNGSRQLLPPGRWEMALGRRWGRPSGSKQGMLSRTWGRRSGAEVTRSSWRMRCKQEPREKGSERRAGGQGRLVGRSREGREVEGAGARRKEGEAPSGADSLGSAHREFEMWLEKERKKLRDLEER